MEIPKRLTVVHVGETSAVHPPLGPGTLLASRRTRKRPQGGPAGRRPWTMRTDSELAARASPPPLLPDPSWPPFPLETPGKKRKGERTGERRAATPLLPRGRRGWAGDTRGDPGRIGKRREEREREGRTRTGRVPRTSAVPAERGTGNSSKCAEQVLQNMRRVTFRKQRAR